MQLNCLLSVYVYTFKHGLLSTLVPEASVCIGKQSINRYTAGENADTMRLGLQTKLAICINTLPRRLWEHRGREGGNNVRTGLCTEDCEVLFSACNMAIVLTNAQQPWLSEQDQGSIFFCILKVYDSSFSSYWGPVDSPQLLWERLNVPIRECGQW